MIVERMSPFSGKHNKMDLNFTVQQWEAWCAGTLIQKAMPQLSPDEREFIMTGITPQEWDKFLKDTDNES